MSTQTLCRVDVGRQPYFLKTTAKDGGRDGFELVITDAINSWEGTISRQRLTQLAQKVNMDEEEFAEVTGQALTRQNMGDLAFEYQMKADKGTGSEFSWKKVMANENIKFQLGSVSLQVVDDPAESIQDLFIFMIQNSSSLRDTIHILERENERLSTERGNALKRLEKCVGMHENMEKELFTKFQVVLNDKKAKIRSLKQELTEATSAEKTQENNSSKRSQLDRKSSREESNEEKDDPEDEEVSTDEESKATQKSKRKAAPSSRMDSSLILEEDPTNETTAPVGKRRRRRDVTNKQTPSKPSIPKVSSVRTERSATPSTPASSQGGRVSRTTSGRSSKAEPDADMLFDEL